MRRLLVHEPRGHADMYGCFVVPPNDDGADLGVVFFHNAGYSTACGHGTIALVTWALDEDVVERREGENHVVVDVPVRPARDVGAGRGRPRPLGSVPERPLVCLGAEASSWPAAPSTSPSAAPSTRPLEERVEPGELPRLIELGRQIKARARGWHDVVHPLEPELRDVYGVIFWQEEGENPLDAAERHGVRGRRGRPLTLRQRHLGAARAPDRAGQLRDGRRASTSLSIVDTEFRGHVVGDDRGRRHPGGRDRGRRERRSARACTCSRSTRTTRSATASCCARIRSSCCWTILAVLGEPPLVLLREQ